MTTQEFAQFILDNREKTSKEPIDESAAKDVAQLISGSLIYRLYESLIVNGYDMYILTEHLEMLYDTQNHFGLLYFIFILSDAANEALPERFGAMTANPTLVPYLSAAMIEDWLDFHTYYES